MLCGFEQKCPISSASGLRSALFFSSSPWLLPNFFRLMTFLICDQGSPPMLSCVFPDVAGSSTTGVHFPFPLMNAFFPGHIVPPVLLVSLRLSHILRECFFHRHFSSERMFLSDVIFPLFHMPIDLRPYFHVIRFRPRAEGVLEYFFFPLLDPLFPSSALFCLPSLGLPDAGFFRFFPMSDTLRSRRIHLASTFHDLFSSSPCSPQPP